MIHDPLRQLSDLRQCLSSDRRPLGLLLGAGCPAAVRSGDVVSTPLIPDIAGMTTIVRHGLSESADLQSLLAILEGHFLEDGRTAANIEDMLTHIRGLRTVAGRATVRGLSADNLDQLDERICEQIHAIADKSLPAVERPYSAVASWIDDVARETSVEIFTTNYDLLVEQALERHRVPYFDGFAGTQRPFFDIRAMEEDILPARWARLWKLHGSINWYQLPDKRVFRGSSTPSESVKRVFHPSDLKYHESRRMPYLAMFDRLRSFLRRPTGALVTCGYSFRDEHINEVIVQGLEATPKSVAFALLHGPLVRYPGAIALALKRSNLNLLARDGAVVGCRKTEWPARDADCVPETDSRWIGWAPVAGEGNANRRRPELLVGDFGSFGDLLADISGRGAPLPGAPNA